MLHMPKILKLRGKHNHVCYAIISYFKDISQRYFSYHTAHCSPGPGTCTSIAGLLKICILIQYQQGVKSKINIQKSEIQSLTDRTLCKSRKMCFYQCTVRSVVWISTYISNIFLTPFFNAKSSLTIILLVIVLF
jgi:hypothetical protein